MLMESMKKVETGEFEKVCTSDSQDYIAQCIINYNSMLESIQQMMNEQLEDRQKLHDLGIKLLYEQINPHFLYNTLDSIIWMSESGKNQEVVLMTSSLAKLLRQSISNEDEIVTIASEIGYTKSYLTIQKMRYKDKLEFEINIDENVLDESIVKLVLQPLVENAIYHGIKYKGEKGLINITGHREDGDIVITIEDNGKGMDEEALKHIFDKKENNNSRGVGVNNVNNRLKLYYGSDYGLIYRSQIDVGTTVEVRIPVSSGVMDDYEKK